MTNIPNAFDRLMKTRASTSNTDRESDIDNPDNRSNIMENALVISHGQEETPHYFKQNVLYNFFIKVGPDTSKCVTCNKILQTPKSTTTTLKRHLKTHPTQFLMYQKSMEEKLLKKKETEVIKRKIEETQLNIENAFKKKSFFPPNSSNASKITKKIAEMIAIDYQPYSIVEDRGFKNLMETIESRYQLPTRKYLSTKEIPQLYLNQMSKLKTEIDTDLIDVQSISFTFDIWTSLSQQSYMSLTMHYLTKHFELKNITLGCIYFPGEHTGQTIFLKIKNMVSKWGIDAENSNTPIYIVTDNARNISSGFIYFNENQHLHHILCTAHTLQLAINDAIKENNMGDVLKKCRSLVSHYNHSAKSYERLYDIQTRLNLPQHKLIQSIDIRWNSVYLMLERILEQKSAIILDLQNIKKNGFVPRDWKLIEGYVEVLKPIFEATKELCQENIPTLSMVNPILYTIETKLKNFISKNNDLISGISFARSVHKSINTRFQVCKTNTVYILATIIDPRFKIVMLEPYEVDAAKEILKIEAETFRTPPTNTYITNKTTEHTLEPSKSSLWDILNERSVTIKQMEGQIDYVLREVQEYLKLPLISPTSNPLTWWSSNQTTFPNLLPVAMKYLGIPATSVCSERMFSKAGQIVTKRRQRLSPSSIEQLVFLHDNL